MIYFQFQTQSLAEYFRDVSRRFEARLKKLEDLRGPGMQRNASVARRFVELCGPWRAAAEAREAKEADSGGSWEPVLAPFMDNSGTAAARNLMSLGLS